MGCRWCVLGVFSVDVDVDVSASGRTVPVTTSRRLYCLFNFVSFIIHCMYVYTDLYELT